MVGAPLQGGMLINHLPGLGGDPRLRLKERISTHRWAPLRGSKRMLDKLKALMNQYKTMGLTSHEDLVLACVLIAPLEYTAGQVMEKCRQHNMFSIYDVHKGMDEKP
jgi:hypothetical protein